MFPWSGPGLTKTSMYGMILFSALFSKRGFSRPTNEVPPVFKLGASPHSRMAVVVFLVLKELYTDKWHRCLRELESSKSQHQQELESLKQKVLLIIKTADELPIDIFEELDLFIKSGFFSK